MIVNVALDLIRPNPFQTRQGEDPLHIENLAKSIKEQGLLQIPSARCTPRHLLDNSQPMGESFQLVFGHSRLAAFKELNKTSASTIDYATMPLNVIELDDQGMFEQAVAENRERKDLSPIEEAQAMLVYRDHFKKTSKEIGELFHLSDSAVRNKMRLLGLPDELKTAVSEGKTTEGACRELIALLDLPEEINIRIGERYGRNVVAELVKHAADGESTEEIRKEVSSIIRNIGERMDRKPWKHTDEFQGEGIVGICKGCEFIKKQDDIDWCLKPACFEAKLEAWEQQYLEQASLLSGIPVIEAGKDGYSDTTGFSYGKEAKLENIRAARCENLRLKWDPYGHKNEITNLGGEGFPNAEIVCNKRQGFCTCLKAMDAGVKIEAAEDGAVLAEEDLKEINRQVRAQQKYNREVCIGLFAKASAIIYDGIARDEIKVWAEIYNSMGYSQGADQAEQRKKIKEGTATLSEIKYWIAEYLAHQKAYSAEPKVLLNHLNSALVGEFGLDPLPISFEGDLSGTSPDWTEKPAGKTLMEVFEGEAEEDGEVNHANTD